MSAKSGHGTFTPATGSRMHWNELPAGLRAALEERLGAAVIEAVTQPGGFSPGLAARLRLADGRRVFVKAVSADRNPESPELHRQEALVAAALPSSVPTPRFLWSYDNDGWVALAFEDIEGHHPQLPWRPAELDRVLAAIHELAADLTPSPVNVPAIGMRMAEQFQGWRTLYASSKKEGLQDLPAWALRNLARLAELEDRWQAAAEGETLLHVDLRADNILLTAERVHFFDWPQASRGAAWVDLAAMLPSVAMQGGPHPWDVFETQPLGQRADPDAVTAVLAALTGYFIQRSRLPPPPGLPTLRAFQRDQGAPALEWLKRRTGWP